MPGQILVGTASWADPGFVADWYPRGLPAGERLPFYAERFNLVELNSSFYAVPARHLVQRWCEQTPDGFTFDVKLHRLLSRHTTTLKSLPPSLRSLAETDGDKVKLTPKLERAVATLFLQEVEPFSATGKLGAFLLQLNPGFSPHRHKLDELDGLLELMEDRPLAVELRNRNWVSPERRTETSKFFRERGVTFVSVDAPDTEHFMVMPGLDLVTNPTLAYLRLHGRNARGFVSGKTVAERFDYLYSDAEVRETAERAAKLAAQAAKTHVIYNNNSSDYALRNAATFQDLIQQNAGGPLRGRPSKPEELEFDFTADIPGTKRSPGQR